MDEFGGWVPLEWHRNQRLIQDWLQKIFGTEDMQKLYNLIEAELFYEKYASPERIGEVTRFIHPQHEPHLSLKAAEFRVPEFNSRDEPQKSCNEAGYQPLPKL